MPPRHRRPPPRLPLLAALLPLAAAGCVQDDPYAYGPYAYGAYDPFAAEQARRWQQEEEARRGQAESAARYRQFEAERQARWREEMERRRAWAAQQRAWERARRAEFGGGHGGAPYGTAPGGEVTREGLPPGEAPAYPQPYGSAAPQPPSTYAAPGAPYGYGYPGAPSYPPSAYGAPQPADPYALPPPQRWY